jgi:two-component system response regulator AtoC
MIMINQKILIVDDEDKMRRVLEIMLQRMGYSVVAANDGIEALDLLQSESFDLVISDLRMPRLDGVALLERLRASGNEVPVIIVTAHGTIESAVGAMKLGACDYILRPFDIEALKLSIDRVFDAGRIRRQNLFLRDELEKSRSGLVGGSIAMQRVHEKIQLVASSKTTVLITGETGTGKELVALAIHRASPRRDALFVPINCAAIPAEIIESELFGYEKGAFTGAHKDRVGKFELASGGTLFLDEITEMPIALQAKLLRVLQESVIERLGSNRSIPLDLRIVAATNRDARRAIEQGRLREDLYYRINVFSIALPSLRDRREDIPELVRHFMAEFSSAGTAAPAITPAALARLSAYDWPGNVRELRNVIERAIVLSRGQTLDVQHFPVEHPIEILPAATEPALEDLDLNKAVDSIESKMIVEALRRSGGNKTKAAVLLQISGRSLWYKLKKYKIED